MTWFLGLWRLVHRGGEWLLEKPMRGVLLVLALHVLVHQFIIDPRLRSQRDAAIAQAEQLGLDVFAERAAHRQTKFDYRAAQAEAASREQERLERVKAEQQEITDDVVADYGRRLADARARAQQLREQLARTGEHTAGAADRERMSAAGDAAGRADGASADRGLSLDERLIATEQAIQLDALIDWVSSQAGVEVNPSTTIGTAP